MTGLPTGWSAQTVKDLLSIRYGKSLAANLRVADGKYPVVGSAGEMARTDESLINGPTIVVGRKGNVGAVQLLTEGGWPIDTTYLSQVSDDLDPRFVAHQLTSLRLVRLDSSTATPSLRRQDYEVQELVVPPLDEQRRIVDILEDHLSRLDAATALLVSADRRASAWSRSVVDVTLWDHKCPRTQVADLLAEQMRNGHSARAVRDGLAGIRTLTLTAVTRNEFTDVFTKVTSADPDRVKGLWLRSGDVLVQRANTPELVGTTAMFNGPDDWAIYPDLLIRLRANEQRVVSGYLCAASEPTARCVRKPKASLARCRRSIRPPSARLHCLCLTSPLNRRCCCACERSILYANERLRPRKSPNLGGMFSGGH